MHLSRLYIKNFRSIKELDLRLRPGKNVIVGRNNCGKSNIVKALDLVMGENNPDWARSENITLNDFHTFREKDAEGKPVDKIVRDLFIWCEITREDSEALNYDELYKCYGFYRCDRGKWGPPMRFDTLPDTYDDAFLMYQDEHEGKTYINPKVKNQATFQAELDDKYRFAIGFKASRDEDNRIRKEARLFYREDDNHHWIMAFKASIRNELLQSAIIPSFRDPQQQLRLTNWTWYGKLIRHLTANHAKLPDLEKAYKGVSKIANAIFTDVREQVSKSTLEVAFPGTELFFQLNPDVQMELYKSCLIYVDDGFKSLLTDKGSGIQSATIMGLFTYYVNNVNTVTAALLCIEEPELYLHPHARRVVSRRLSEFVGTRNQVILTTHSAEFLRTDGEEVHVLSVKHDLENGTHCVAVDLKDFSDVILGEAVTEIFFADAVIVCEGFDDYVIRALGNEYDAGGLDRKNISVVSVGGKDLLHKLVRLVMKLGTKCYLVADFDYLLRDKGEDRKAHNAKAHESILSLPREFFQQECTFGGNGADVYRKIQKLRSRIKRESIAAFYTAKRLSECTDKGVEEVLTELRTNGVLVLSGQIEDACTDGTFAATKKLTMERIFRLNRRLARGVNIVDVFDGTEFTKFFDHVFNQ